MLDTAMVPLIKAAMEAQIDAHLAQQLASSNDKFSDRILKLEPGRRTGKTQLIAEMCSEYDIVIVVNRNMERDIQRRISERSANCPWIFISQEAPAKMQGLRTNRVWIDEAQLILANDTDRYNLYHALAHTDCKQIILLG